MHLADEQFLLGERYLAKKNLWSVKQELEDKHFPKKRQFRTNVSIKKEQYVEVLSPLI
jgi:hypothetical protein